MYMSKILAAFTVIITLLFNWFPECDIIADMYYNVQASEFGWVEITDTIEEAVEKKDAHTLALMASQKLKEKHPNLENEIQKLFNSIKGNILAVEDISEFSEMIYHDYSLSVTTTTDEYSVDIFYTAVGPDDSVFGIRRVMLTEKTDEYYSWWADTENYITEGIIENSGTSYTRRWCCGKGNTADEYVFMVVEDYSRLKGYKNVEFRSSRNDWGVDVPATGYAFSENDVLKVHLIPEGEEPPAPGTREPDVVITKDNRHPECYVEPGKYYLYVEPSDMQMYYTVSVITKL